MLFANKSVVLFYEHPVALVLSRYVLKFVKTQCCWLSLSYGEITNKE